jgi:hypothetical protein
MLQVPAVMVVLMGVSGEDAVPARRYLRMVFRDKPVRREISRIESGSRNAQRQITLNNAMSVTPSTHAENSHGGFKTWVNSQRKIHDPRVKSWRNSTAHKHLEALRAALLQRNANAAQRSTLFKPQRPHIIRHAAAASRFSTANGTSRGASTKFGYV